jgi:tryptophan 2,3-dioxygenase
MSPWEYQEIRKILGHGSGFDSPGWNELRRILPRLGQAFHNARREAGLSLAELYVQGRDHEQLYQLAEALIELDEQAQLWRMRHYQIVARVIGDSVVGTQGTPVELLGRLQTKTSYPEPEVRNELTALSKAPPREPAEGRAAAGAATARHRQPTRERDQGSRSFFVCTSSWNRVRAFAQEPERANLSLESREAI